LRLAASVLAVSIALVAGLVGCSGEEAGSDRASDPGADEPRPVTLVLDFLPNGVHAGIYQALESGAYLDEGIDLEIITPTSTADTIRLIQADQADFGLADGIDIAGQISKGRDVRAVMAVTQRPSGGLITIAGENIRSPAGLAGRTVGITGVPSDTAVFETMVEDAGGSPADSRVVTVGFGGIQALLAGRISAFTGYVPADSAVIEAQGTKTRSFAFDEFGGPSYPGLVAFSTGDRIAEDPELVADFVRATEAGYREALQDPEAAIDAMAGSVQGLDVDLESRIFRAYEPLIGNPAAVGSIDRRRVAELSDFMVREGLITEPFDPDLFDASPD
jgi:NitT/TauT family transport system substrate-binding protein/putative hydroxymethylpyrimidine transport system substrate-binding protein